MQDIFKWLVPLNLDPARLNYRIVVTVFGGDGGGIEAAWHRATMNSVANANHTIIIVIVIISCSNHSIS